MWQIAYLGEVHGFDQVHVAGIEIGGIGYDVDDANLPRRDGVWMGEDFARPGDIVVRLSINCGSEQDPIEQRRIVRERANAFTALWDAERLRASPGSVAELTADEFGMFEGRPRSVSWNWDKYAAGFVAGKARFVRTTTLSYATDADGIAPWYEQSVGLVPPPSGGIVFPLVFPMSTALETSRASAFTVGGTDPSWPVIRVQGPINAGCSVELTSRWSVTITSAIAWDQVVEIDTRPGRQACTVNGVPQNVLDPMTDYSQLYLSPGPAELGLRGTSMTGTAKATIRWRETRGAI